MLRLSVERVAAGSRWAGSRWAGPRWARGPACVDGWAWLVQDWFGCGRLGSAVVASARIASGVSTSDTEAAQPTGMYSTCADVVAAGRAVSDRAVPGGMVSGLAGAGRTVPGRAVPGGMASGLAGVGRVVAGGVVAGLAAAGGVVSGRVVAGGVVAGLAAAGGVVSGRAVAGGVVAGLVAAGGVVSGRAVSSGMATGLAGAGRAVSGRAVSGRTGMGLADRVSVTTSDPARAAGPASSVEAEQTGDRSSSTRSWKAAHAAVVLPYKRRILRAWRCSSPQTRRIACSRRNCSASGE
jgi:hypothetical protein